jgi:hypothetical protein
MCVTERNHRHAGRPPSRSFLTAGFSRSPARGRAAWWMNDDPFDDLFRALEEAFFRRS